MTDCVRLAFAVPLFAACLSAACAPGRRAAPADLKVEEPAPDVETVEEYWPNGQLRIRRQVIREPDGTLIDHGPYTSWYDNGQKEYEAVFVHGKKDGVVTRWHRNGQKWMEERYAHGKKHGTTYVWDEAGRKRKEENYSNGKPHGTWTVWDAEGRVKWQATFEHGRPQP
jgi:antitoxin component YwqK of YwqJK toxin-antitoxin module